ncbi:MAG TPA: alpha/beta hydrolase [Chloroflexota bacterium]
MNTVTSRDGTPIAFDRIGSGPPLIFALGAFNDRHTGQALAEWLSSDFTVYAYDRRGRGDSGDASPYAVDREIEDLQAVMRHAGPEAYVFGFSSGAVLALNAAACGLPISRLALYEPPPTEGQAAAEHADKLAELVAAGRRGDAVEYFQKDIVGIPAEIVAQMRQSPFRPALDAMAHTLVYEMRILGERRPVDNVQTPTLIVSGADSMGSDKLNQAAQALAKTMPNAEHLTLNGLNHDLVPEALGPELKRFFGG